MRAYSEDDRVIVEGVKDFNTDHIFDSGQCFRWEKEEDGSYTGVALGRVVNINFVNGKIILDNTTLDDFNKVWRAYLDLDRDYTAIKKNLGAKDSIMAKAISCGEGLRILKQEKWETLISFIISQNNNIPRIKKCIESICQSFGEIAGEYKGKKYYTFPGPEIMAKLTVKDLEPVRLGYRTKYILETAKAVAADENQSLSRMGEADSTEAYDYLMNLCGVGPKVANCISLFSMGNYESFPIDVWIKRVMNELYCIDENDTKAMQRYANENFGEYGGIAQQYLFYYMRQNASGLNGKK